VVNASGRVKLNDRFAVGVDVSNLLDDDHFETFGGDILHRRALAFVSIGW
jgi:outer membrane receptor protein involved in Fe transport